MAWRALAAHVPSSQVQQATATELHGKRELLRVQQQQLEQSIGELRPTGWAA